HWTPETRVSVAKCVSPYYYDDSLLTGFRASHWMSGSCTQDYGSYTLAPVMGGERWRRGKLAQPLDHRREQARPDRYDLELEGLSVSLTAGTYAGLLRLEARRADTLFLLVRPNQRDGRPVLHWDAEAQQLVGRVPVQRIYQGWGEDAGFGGHFVVEADLAPVQQGAMADPEAYWLAWPLDSGQVLQLRTALSWTDTEGARNNLRAEIPDWDFGRRQEATAAAWETLLGRVQVQGGEPGAGRRLYTALYHSLLLPRTFSDADGRYPGFAGDTTIHRAEGFTYYTDFSLWDTYRTLHPLLTLLAPERTRDMMQSLVVMAEQGGWLPIFPAWNQYTGAMIGDHAQIVLSEAWRKGIRGWEVERVYPYLVQNATQSPATRAEYLDGKGRRALDSYLEYGYIPLEEPVKEAFHQMEQVSRTLEYAHDDYALGRLAEALGKEEDARHFLARAQNYRHVFDPETRFMRGRHQDGHWQTPFEPAAKEPPVFTEGTSWQYSWYVPQDVAGLIELMGGREAFIAKLDSFFAGGHYWHGNEPSHHIAFLYQAAGAPARTQARVREILAAEYGDGPGGLSGNDDCGQVSAWYVMAALGLYPRCPGDTDYYVGSPLFETVTLQLGAGRSFRIEAPGTGPDRFQIVAMQLNGQPRDRFLLDHAELLAGGLLVLELE
ncbi:MAG: glycoside hydrolase family 92 protein, partial [Bacteroidetes bacterium]